jgi:hypothetical protein
LKRHIHVTGDVKNTGDVQLRIARAYMHLYDSNGALIDKGMSIITNLDAGDTTDFTVTGYGKKYDMADSYDVVLNHQV